MPIEFHCPGCGKLMRTPDATAGRKGQCPHCGTKVQIPDRSLASLEPAAPIPIAASESAVPTAPGTATSIRFNCSTCGRTLSVPSSSAGKQGRCPGCGAVSQIPAASTVAASAAAVSPPTSFGAAGPATTANQFACPACKKTVRVPASGLGGRGKCPHCGAIVMMPGSAAAKPSAAPASPGGGLDDLFADLPGPGPAPVDPLGGLGGDPFAGGGGAAGGWPAGGFGDANPYAASFGGGRSRAPVHTNKPKRIGLPWDNRATEDSAFWSTAKLVLFSPKQAFYKMHRTGGLVGPLLFCISGVVTGTLVTVAYNIVLQVVSLALAISRVNNPQGVRWGPLLIEFAIGVAVGLIVGLVAAVLSAVTTAFLNGGLIHLCLHLIGGAEHSFETTFRVVCYALGAASVCQIVPVCGGLFGVVANFTALIVGMYAAHETTGWKAVLGVLLPTFILGAVCAMFIFAVYSTLIGLVPHPASPTGG